MKPFLIVLGFLAAALIVGQLVLGQLILSGRANLVKAHQHSGYTAVVVALLYIALSLPRVIAAPKEARMESSRNTLSSTAMFAIRPARR